MIQGLRNELTAAIALSVAVLLGSGYLITWARLKGEGVETRPVLSALPNAAYIGVAIESLILVLVVLLVLSLVFAAIWFLPRTGAALRTGWPPGWAWALFGAAAAAVCLALAGAPPLFPSLRQSDGGYALISLGLAVFITAAATLAGIGAGRFGRRGVLLALAAVLVISVVAAVAFRIADGLSRHESLAEAEIILPSHLCAQIPEARPTARGCSVGGLYLGESSQWFYLAKREATVPGHPTQPGRLILVPRDQAVDAVIATRLPKPGR